MLTSPGRASQQHHPRIGGLDSIDQGHQLVYAARPSEKPGAIGDLKGGESLVGADGTGGAVRPR